MIAAIALAILASGQTDAPTGFPSIFPTIETPGTCGVGVLDCEYSDDDVDKMSPGCANYNNYWPQPIKMHGIMGVSSVTAMVMAFGIGANDAANSWATSVGSKAIGVGKAVILCGIFEWAGATTVGYGVSKTIQKGVAKLTDEKCWACGYCNSEVTIAMGGSMGALIGASLFLLLCSGSAIPVSTTHSIVGGVVGMTVIGAGSGCLNWKLQGGLGGIIASWVISPLLSGFLASTFYSISRFFVIKAKNPFKRALIAVPLLYGLSMFGLTMMILLKAKAIKKALSLVMKMVVSAIIAVAVGVVGFFYTRATVEDHQPSLKGTTHLYISSHAPPGDYRVEDRKSVIERMQEKIANLESIVRSSIIAAAPTANANNGIPEEVEMEPRGSTSLRVIESGAPSRGRGSSVADKDEAKVQTVKETPQCNDDSDSQQDFTKKEFNDSEEERYEMRDAETVGEVDAIFVFKNILVFNACLESFAHGSNDTANATGPFSAVYQFYTQGRNDCGKDEGTVWILSIAGLFVALGVFTFGYRVIRTIGTNLTVIDFHKGFYIEFGSTLATMAATILELPVSTTHCQVGAVIGVGLVTKYQGTGDVNWWLFSKIALTWVLTLPIAGGIAGLITLAVKGALQDIKSCPADISLYR